ncbi:MAG: MinD/ParA family protein [bacterium]
MSIKEKLESKINDQASKLREIVASKGTNNEILERKEKKNARIIAIASGKGGVGKSNVSVNLALTMQKKGMKTLIIDADMGMANIDVLLGMTPQYNLSHVLRGQHRFEEVVLEGPHGMHFLPGTSGASNLTDISGTAIQRLLDASDFIEDNYDVVLIDVGAGGHRGTINFIKAADEAIIVLTPEPTAIMDAYSMIKILDDSEYGSSINLLINQVGSNREGESVSSRMEKVIKQYLGFEINTIGYIPYDRKVSKSVKEQKPITSLYPNSKASYAIEEITNSLLNRKNTKPSKGMKSFVNRMVGIFNN